ncbi:hypothetical protein QR680_007603 [Steinernema hermaphroditum]|uniref:Uncharacterized protein n=1 Tax=Steinernema hermaphroditum TaxID=289476 RepID=A0AA39M5M2_9BILA|nr:hypothetical protein QR680_007603 [Steinernema hermaphroditum]
MLSWTAVGVSAFVGTLSIVFGVYIYGTHSGALQSYSTVIQGPKAVAINATYERQANVDRKNFEVLRFAVRF